MNRIFTVLLVVFLSASLRAQAPQSFSYQAVIRGTNNSLVANKPVGMKISLLQGSENGNAVYVETHKSTSNVNGLVSIAIGGGKKDPSSSAFTTINWANGPFFVKTETDVTGGVNYSLTSVSQLLSVPYALYAGNSLPSGGMNGQGLTICDGIPTWTTGDICPGKITSLNCDGVSVNGLLSNGVVASNVSFMITYTGGNGGPYSSQVISSEGVVGLEANLESGSYSNGNGTLIFTVSGKATSVGNALFSLNIAGLVCTVSMAVQVESIIIGIPGPNISDVEGNSYKTVTIGTQQWMAENLKVSKYNDGSIIPKITDDSQWQTITTGAWSYYNNDLANNSKYGKLYNWYAVSSTMNGNNNNNVCPSGWHVPTDTEWTVLSDYLGGIISAGGKMKEIGINNWVNPNTDATNTSLFTGLPGGYRYVNGSYYSIGESGYWWSSSENNTNEAWYRPLSNNSGTLNKEYNVKRNGFSVRCLKD
jgi:uncharacterized protein (TIGR02145 family)